MNNNSIPILRSIVHTILSPLIMIEQHSLANCALRLPHRTRLCQLHRQVITLHLAGISELNAYDSGRREIPMQIPSKGFTITQKKNLKQQAKDDLIRKRTDISLKTSNSQDLGILKDDKGPIKRRYDQYRREREMERARTQKEY